MAASRCLLILSVTYLTLYTVAGQLDVDGVCYYNNTRHKLGDTFPSTDGCNNCSCHSSFVSCTKCFCMSLGKRFISSSSNNNNNNNNNNNHNTVVTSTVVIVTNPVTCRHNGASYGLAQGYLGTDGCTICSCTQGGIVCNSLSCPSHQPANTDYYKCKYAGMIHNFGDTFSHADGCNQCVCGLISIQCTDATACKPTTPAYDCTDHGVGYMSGQSFPHPDGCNMCQCTILGVLCTSNTCTTTTTTTTMAPYTCEWFGKFYHDGDMMPVDGCHTCICSVGQATCSAGMNCPIAHSLQ